MPLGFSEFSLCFQYLQAVDELEETKKELEKVSDIMYGIGIA